MPDERTTLKNAVNKYLTTLEPDVFWEKRSPGLGSKTGTADYTGIAWGLPFALEIKHPNGRGVTKADQKLYAKKVTRAGGYAYSACSVGEVVTFMFMLAEVAQCRRAISGTR